MPRRTPSPATKQDRGDLHRSCRGPAPNGVVVRPAISLGTPRRPRNASPNPARVAPNPPRQVVHQQYTEGDYELAIKGFTGLPNNIPDAFRKARSASSLMVEIMRMDHSVFSSMILDANSVAEAKVPAACLYRNMQLAKSTVKGLEKKEQKTKDPGGQMAKLAATLTSLRKNETVRDLMILKDLVREVDVSTNLFDPLLVGLRNQELAMHDVVQSSILRMRRNAGMRPAHGQGAAPAQLPARGMVPAQAAQIQGPPQIRPPASQGAAFRRPAGAPHGIAPVAQAGTQPTNSSQRAPARTQGINGNRQDQQVPGPSSHQRSPVRRRSSPTSAPLTQKRRRSSSPPGTVSSALVPSAVANAMAQLSTLPQRLTVPSSSTTAHRPMMTVQGPSRPAQTSNPGVQAAARMPDRSLPSQSQLSSPTPSATLSAPPPVPKKQVVSTDDRPAPTSPSFNQRPANRPNVGVRHGRDLPAPVASNTGRNAAPAQNGMTSRNALPTTVPPPRQRNVGPAADTGDAADQSSTSASSGRMSAPTQDSSLSTVGMSSPQPSPLPSTVPPLNRRPIVGMASRADPMSPSFNQGPANGPDVGERHGGVRTAGPATTPVTTRTTAQNPTHNNGNAFFAGAQQAGNSATTGGGQQPGADGRSSPDASPRPTSAPQLPRRQMLSLVPGLHSPPPSTAPSSPPPLPRRK